MGADNTPTTTLSAMLQPSSYTIEATTYASKVTGFFDLHLGLIYDGLPPPMILCFATSALNYRLQPTLSASLWATFPVLYPRLHTNHLTLSITPAIPHQKFLVYFLQKVESPAW